MKNIINKSKLIISHRGFRNKNFENGLKSLINSHSCSDIVEFDVQFTKDYIPVIIHDYTINRMLDIKEKKKIFIKSHTYEELSSYKINGESLLKLEDYFCKISKENYFNLEIKTIPKKFDENKCIKIINNLILKYDFTKNCLISAFNHNHLKIIKELNPEILISALDENKKRKNLIDYLKNLNVVSYNINEKMINKEIILKLKENNIKTFVYTINTKESIDNLFNIGVNGIFTDNLYIKSL